MDTHGTDCVHGDDVMMDKFLHLALHLNEELGTAPLLFGSLDLGLRPDMDPKAHDIDVPVPGHHPDDGRNGLITIMQDDGYVLYDLPWTQQLRPAPLSPISHAHRGERRLAFVT